MAVRSGAQADAVSGPPGVWSAQAILAGAAGLLVGTVLGFELNGFRELTLSTPVPPDGPDGAVLIVPFLLCFGGPFALLSSLFVVVPTVAVARWASVRFSGRDARWWPPAVAVLVATVGALLYGAVLRPEPGSLAVGWAAGVLLLGGSAWAARDAALHGGRLPRVLGGGVLAALVVLGLGAVLLATGLVTEYRPPKVDAARLMGTWGDGHGGTLRLAPDGTAAAVSLDRDGGGHCSGTGTWTYEPGGSTTWAQRVRVDVHGCLHGGVLDGWSISGTPERPRLSLGHGDADAPDWYTLTRR